jgi:carboxyl-terminal processing protease
MKHLLPSTALALFIGIGSLMLGGNAFAANSWDSLQPDRDESSPASTSWSCSSATTTASRRWTTPLGDHLRQLHQAAGPVAQLLHGQRHRRFDKWKTQFDDFLKSGDLNPASPSTSATWTASSASGLRPGRAEQGRRQDRLHHQGNLADRPQGRPLAEDQAELDDLWRKRVKDEVLRQKIAGKEPKQIQETLTKRYKNQLARLDQTRAEDIFQAYINTFAMSYDPHTNYLSPDNAENFDINMSLSLEGIGAVLQSDNDQVKIVRLVPAGPADKTKQVARPTRSSAWPRATKKWSTWSAGAWTKWSS